MRRNKKMQKIIRRLSSLFLSRNRRKLAVHAMAETMSLLR